MGFGASMTIYSTNRSMFLSICCDLGNLELYEAVCGSETAELTIDKAIDRLQFHSRIGINLGKEVEFVSSHFYELSDATNSLQSIDASVIFDVICHPSLKIRSEDSLYDFILHGMSRNGDFFNLLEFIRFGYLSLSKFKEFFELIRESFEYLTVSLWTDLRNRLSLPVSSTSSNDRIHEFVKQPPDRSVTDFTPTSPLNGIVAYLTRQCGGNVHDNGIVVITASSSYGTRPAYLADLEQDMAFQTHNSSDSWFCYDFKGRTIKPTHYSIQSHYSTNLRHHPRSWIIEGSVNGSSWTELDRRENNTELNGVKLTRTFSISQSEEIRMIRMRQIGLNHAGNHHLLLTAFEVFGSLFE
jgi:hypothetical protein